MQRVLSVNVGRATPSEHATPGVTGIDKRPVAGAVGVRDPGPRGGGLAGDDVCDWPHHGGADKAVYAYAREDLDDWEPALGRELTHGTFGENLTTAGLDVTAALVGGRWRVGDDLLLEVVQPRIPCRTFAGWLAERGWVRTFTLRARPGAYLRVLEPGDVRAGDPIRVEYDPPHDVSIGVFFRAMTTEPELLPRLLAVETLVEQARHKVLRYASSGDPRPVSG